MRAQARLTGKQHRLCLLLVVAAASLPAGCATRSVQVASARDTGPWSLPELYQTPTVSWGSAEGKARPLYYTGEPFEGKPTRVFAWCALPTERSAPVPGIVLVHGGGGKAFREWAELWAGRGYAAIAMDLAGRGPDGERLPDGGPDQKDPEKFGAIARGVTSAWPYHAVANVIRAHSLLRSIPEVDPNRTAITGISWGGYLTCIVSGLDGRFRVAVPVYGCGFLYENSVWVKTFESMPPPDRRLWIETYDPSRYLPGCRTPILFVNGTNDFAYPLDSYQKSYRLVQGPRTLCVTVRMPHGHEEGWAPKEIGLFVDSVLTGGVPLATLGLPRRHGIDVQTTCQSEVRLVKAELHYTADSGAWQQRTWQTAPARLEPGQIRATLPTEKNLVYFLTVTDERGAVVSTEHEEIRETSESPRKGTVAEGGFTCIAPGT